MNLGALKRRSSHISCNSGLELCLCGMWCVTPSHFVESLRDCPILKKIEQILQCRLGPRERRHLPKVGSRQQVWHYTRLRLANILQLIMVMNCRLQLLGLDP